jgi:hypothetical protein
MPQSVHPMDAVDREIVLKLLDVRQPTNMDIVNAARLLTRYRDSLLSADLYDLLQKVAANWRLTMADIQNRSREIWLSGWRPTFEQPEAQVGSGSDVEG